MGANQFIPLPLPNPAFQPFIDPNLRTVVGVTNANPAEITTAAPHGFLGTDIVVVRGVLGMGDVPNGIFAIIVTGPSTFQLVGADTTATGLYAGSGKAALSGRRYVGTISNDLAPAPGGPIRIESLDKPAFGGAIDDKLLPGDPVKISGNTTLPEINGIFTTGAATPPSATEFTLVGTSYTGPALSGGGTIDLGPFPVICQTPTPHGYTTGSVVDVRANPGDPGQLFEITVISPTQFSLDFQGENVQYPLGGIVRQVSTGVLDLAAIVPPNGVEKRKTFSVAGDYSGRLIIEGSMDNDKFSPFLLFNEGKPGGIKVVEVNVPYIRTRGEGLVINSGTLVGFMAAEQNCDCDPAWSDHGANVYDNLDVPDPVELPFDREEPFGIVGATSNLGVVQIETSGANPYVTGDRVRISGVADALGALLPSVNGVWTITVLDQFNFTLDTSVYVADGFGGQAAIITSPNVSPIPLITAAPHGYATGDTVRVRGVSDPETPVAIATVFSPDNLTPIMVTTAALHGYTTGNRVQIASSAIPDGTYTITVTGAFTFTLNGFVGPVNGTGGTSLRITGANGDYTITVPGPSGPNSFTLNAPPANPGAVPTGDGTGGTVQALASGGSDTSNFKSEKTIQLQGGPYTGTFIVEGTLDPGPSPIFLPFSRRFNTGGADEKLELDALFAKMRITPEGASGDVAMYIGSQLACACPPAPPVPLTCCPCADPVGAGRPDPESFCTEFPAGAIDPFAETAHDLGFTRTTSGDDTILSFDGTQGAGALFMEAPGPLVDPAQPGSFCFCAVMAQDVVTPGTPFTPVGGAYVGLTSGPFNEQLFVATVNPQTGASFTTYQIVVYEGAGPTQFLVDTGVPIDGTLHKFVVCRDLTPTGFLLSVDNGAPIPFDPGFLPGQMVPFIGINALGPDALGNPFVLTVDSFCTSNQLNLLGKARAKAKVKSPAKLAKSGRGATASDLASSGSIHNRAAAKRAKKKPIARAALTPKTTKEKKR
jgi:hypothetical protein